MQFASRHEVMQGGSRDALGSHPCQVPGLDYADGARLLPTTNPEDPVIDGGNNRSVELSDRSTARPLI